MRSQGSRRGLDRRGAEGALHRRSAASAEAVSSLRGELVWWLRALRVPADVARDIALAGYEAMANVVTHAYPRGTSGFLELHARLVRQLVTVTVVDRGRRDPAVGGGRGLELVRRLPHRVWIRVGEHGTVVSMSWHRRRGLGLVE